MRCFGLKPLIVKVQTQGRVSSRALLPYLEGGVTMGCFLCAGHAMVRTPEALPEDGEKAGGGFGIVKGYIMGKEPVVFGGGWK